MSDPKKHHFLPQFYLKQFKIFPQETKYPKIHQISKENKPEAETPSIKDIGCKTNYHTLDFPDQERDRKSIENVFSKLETKQAEPIKEVCKTNQISENIKPELANFIATMRYRVPAFKKHIEESLEGVKRSTFNILMHQKKLPPPPQELEELFQKQGYDCIKPKIFNWKILQSMLEMAFNSKDSFFFRKMKWKLILAPSGSSFITGDSPVSIYHHNHEAIRTYGVGLAFKNVEVTVPISKKHLIKLTWHGKNESFEAKEDQVSEYNRRTIIMAKRYIFASKNSPYLEKQIIQFHDFQAGYKYDNMWYGKGAVHIARFIPVTD